VYQPKPAVVSCLCVLASLCCYSLRRHTPRSGSGAFMAFTMRIRSFSAARILGVAGGYVLYARERRRCRSLVCTMARIG